jgi:hypothetical protein
VEIMMSKPDLDKVQLEWCKDILKRIRAVLDDQKNTDADKIESTRWLVKQALKIEREDD